MNETLYNGIVLPTPWPPVDRFPDSLEPMPVPYLCRPPETIPIDTGRQLFVDDFLIATTDLQRTFHQPRKFSGNPVFQAGPGPERDLGGVVYLCNGGIFYDPSQNHFKMFYVAGWRGALAMATSHDLLHWTRPALDAEGGNRCIQRSVDDNCIWLDLHASDPEERYKFIECHRPKALPPGVRQPGHHLYVSPDALHWSDPVPAAHVGDYSSFFHNPFRNRWIFSIKPSDAGTRRRRYLEAPEFLKGTDWAQSVHWVGADRLDLPEPEGAYPGAGDPCQLYSLNAVAYESLMVGMFAIHRGPSNQICGEGKFPKLTDLEVGFSRDGFHWDRPDRRGFLRGERREGSWDRAYLHSPAGLFAVFEDRLAFLYTAYSGVGPDGAPGRYHGAAIGLAELRRDGFASMDATRRGTLTTRPLRFSGSELFVNAKVEGGRLRAELRDAANQPLPGFSLDQSQPFRGDQVRQRLEWKQGGSLAPLAGQPVRIHFELEHGSLFAFWVSPDTTGSSNGYLGAGSPDYQDIIDR